MPVAQESSVYNAVQGWRGTSSVPGAAARRRRRPTTRQSPAPDASPQALGDEARVHLVCLAAGAGCRGRAQTTANRLGSGVYNGVPTFERRPHHRECFVWEGAPAVAAAVAVTSAQLGAEGGGGGACRAVPFQLKVGWLHLGQLCQGGRTSRAAHSPWWTLCRPSTPQTPLGPHRGVMCPPVGRHPSTTPTPPRPIPVSHSTPGASKRPSVWRGARAPKFRQQQASGR